MNSKTKGLRCQTPYTSLGPGGFMMSPSRTSRRGTGSTASKAKKWMAGRSKSFFCFKDFEGIDAAYLITVFAGR